MTTQRVILPVVALMFASSASQASQIGPSAYECFDATQTTGIGAAFSGTCTDESPLAAELRAGDFIFFEFEDWESFDLNAFVDPIPTTTNGVTITAAGGGGVSVGSSPDQEDGDIDGLSNSNAGFSQVRNAFGRDVEITFDPSELGGALPTHVGLVTVGAGNFNSNVRVEFFGPGDILLGTIDDSLCPSPLPSGSGANCNTVSEDDLFYGWFDIGGIARVTIDDPINSANLVNFDHLQYGTVIPVPPALLLFGSALGLLGWARSYKER